MHTLGSIALIVFGVLVLAGVWFLHFLNRPVWPPQTRVERFFYRRQVRKDEEAIRKYEALHGSLDD
jgi:hypothetical protein